MAGRMFIPLTGAGREIHIAAPLTRSEFEMLKKILDAFEQVGNVVPDKPEEIHPNDTAMRIIRALRDIPEDHPASFRIDAINAVLKEQPHDRS